MMIEIEIPIAPVAKQRAFIGSEGNFTPDKTVNFENSLKWWWKSKGHKMFPAIPTKVTATFYMQKPKRPKAKHPIVRPDCDNLMKSVMDGLNRFAWKDDAQITNVSAMKRYGEPRIVLRIEADE